MVMAGSGQNLEEQYIDSPIGFTYYLNSFSRQSDSMRLNQGPNGAYMSVQITGAVGPQVLSDGTVLTSFRQGRTGELMVTELQGRYYESVLRGQVFSACNPASQATSAALATTYTGCCVTNPPTSGKNLIIIAAGFSSVAAPGGIINAGLMGGFGTVTHTAALIIHSNLVQSAMTGSASGTVALADSQATIPTPVLLMPLHDGVTSAALSTASSPATSEIAGMFTVAPGAFIAIYTFTAAAGEGFICWQELPT